MNTPTNAGAGGRTQRLYAVRRNAKERPGSHSRRLGSHRSDSRAWCYFVGRQRRQWGINVITKSAKETGALTSSSGTEGSTVLGATTAASWPAILLSGLREVKNRQKIKPEIKKKISERFEPLVPGFKHAAFNDISARICNNTGNTCAVMLEPIQG